MASKELHPILANDIGKALGQSESYMNYASRIYRYYQNRDITLKWIVAASACGPFISKIELVSNAAASWFLALVPLIAILLPLLNYGKVIGAASDLHGSYSELVPILRDLWRRICSNPTDEELNEIEIEFKKAEQEIALIRQNKTEIPDNKKIKEIVESEKSEYVYKESSSSDDNSPPSYSNSYDGGSVVNFIPSV